MPVQQQWELDQTQVLPDQNSGLEQHWAAAQRQRAQENLRVQAPRLVVHQTLQAAKRLGSHQQHVLLNVNEALGINMSLTW